MIRPEALGVARAHAWEMSADHPLFTDPYAQQFLDAAGTAEPDPDPERKQIITNYSAARTKWFDEYFLASSSAGVSQVVILAAGLDARAWRLPWLDDTVVYDVDQPDVLAFKAEILSASGTAPAAKYIPVGIDLRDDWPHALKAAGFDHTEPTAWAAEGLFPSLPSAAQDQLLEQVALYSARGSRIAVEAGEHTEIAAWLCCHRWEVSATDARELLKRYHRGPLAGDDDPLARSVFVEGRLI